MDKSNTLNILKNAFLMEKKGRTLYETAMGHAKDAEVKAFFKELVDDEQQHMNILEEQFKSYMKDGKFAAGSFETYDQEVNAPDILDQNLKDKIGAASFEATAITAAIIFEQKAVNMYAQRAKETSDPDEKKIYNWLSTWEKTHLKKLMSLEESLIESVWHDNSFWPM